MRYWISPNPIYLLAASLLAPALFAQQANVVERMAFNEKDAHDHKEMFTYLSEEHSSRTGGHRWTEKVVETDDGPLRRLILVDGRPLDAAASRAEDRHVEDIVAHPDAFRKANEARKNDELRSSEILHFLPTAFILTYAGNVNGCTRFDFRPNPAFQPSGIEQRVIHAMEGTVTLKEPENRLCTLEARVAHPVEFGFGLLGRVNQGGSFYIERQLVTATLWKTVRIDVHIDGRLLLMKTITRDQETIRTHVKQIPHLSLAQAAVMSRP
jgi:hypothetical protein